MAGFAFKTLLADRRKLLIALLGVIFSLVLLNVQGGMFIGLIRKSTLLIDHSDADIWVGHRGVQNADITADIPRSWAYRIRGVAGVVQAEPYIVNAGMMQLPSGSFEGVLIVGFDPQTALGGPWAFASGGADALRQPDSVSIDRLDRSRLGDAQVGDVLEINRVRARVTAETDGIVGFITTPYVFTTLQRAQRYTRMASDRCSYLLVKLAENADAEDVASEVRRRLPDADVYRAPDFSWKTRLYWIIRTGLGMSFGSSTLLGLAVGLAMVAQSLYAFVVDHLEGYAVLKAIGATDRQIGTILIGQGLAIAAIGCSAGHVVSWSLKAAISSPRLTIAITPTLMIVSTSLAVLICVISSLLPLKRIRSVDPVMVLQG